MQLRRVVALGVFAAVLAVFTALPAQAGAERPSEQPPIPIAPVDDAWRANLPRDATAATQAYLDRLSPAAVARANAYNEGQYWLLLWGTLLTVLVSWLMLSGQRAARVRQWAQRVGRFAWLRDGLVGGLYGLSAGVLMLPLTVYQGYVREHAYGMSTQSLTSFLGEHALGLVGMALATAVAVPLLYAVMRRSGAMWWAWGAATCTFLLALLLLVSPVVLDPLFNTYRPVSPGPVRDAVLAMALSNGVPVTEVYEFDASRQTTRISANVSGLGSTAAIRLNDNLLRRTSLAEIRAVSAHEIGHYTLNHGPDLLMKFGLLIAASFAACQWAMRRLLDRYGARWGTRQITDVASLPVLAAVFSIVTLLSTPVFNTLIRTNEVEADRFGLNLARDPHGFAEAILKLAEYRKPDPCALEEAVFFHHPSARARIYYAMRWREAMGTP